MNRLLWLLLATWLCLTSCEHKELCYDHRHYRQVRVNFDWQLAPEAYPSGMVLFFYDMDGGKQVQRFDLSGREGGQIDLLPGRYRVMFYNNDTETTLFRGTATFEEHQAYTATESISRLFSRTEAEYPRPRAVADEEVAYCPDMIWGCTESDVEVEREQTGTMVLTLTPHALVAIYSYEIRNVVNIDALESYAGLLSGMANSITLANEATRSDLASVPFVSDGVEGDTLTGEFYTFGVTDDDAVPHILTLYAWMRDGQKAYYNFDVTQQVVEAQNPMRVHLVIDGLELPEPSGEGNYSADVNEWQTDYVDIEM
jgi:hypothetical protein